MKIVFFGAGHGVPEPNRKCSSALIEVGAGRYIIDMGTQSIEDLRTRGIPAESTRREEGDYIEYVVRIPKQVARN